MIVFHYYRSSSKHNRLVYKGPDAPSFDNANVDYSEFNKIERVDGVKLHAQENPTKLIEGDDFINFGAELSRLTNEVKLLDADVGTQTELEQQTIQALEERFAEEKAELEHNYNVAKMELGETAKETSEAKDILEKGFEDFIFELEMAIYQQAVQQQDQEAARAAKIRRISSAIGANTPNGEGMGEYILEANNPAVINAVFADPLPNKEEFNRRLQKALNEGVLENAAEMMMDEIDSNQSVTQIERNKTFFNQAIAESLRRAGPKGENNPKLALTQKIGIDEKDELSQALAERFKVVEESDGKTYIIDLQSENLNVYPAAEFTTIPGGALKQFCDSQYTTKKDLKKRGKELRKKQKEDTKRRNELLKGVFRGRSSRLDEIRGLKSMKNKKGTFNNETFLDVFSNAQNLKNNMEDASTPPQANSNQTAPPQPPTPAPPQKPSLTQSPDQAPKKLNPKDEAKEKVTEAARNYLNAEALSGDSLQQFIQALGDLLQVFYAEDRVTAMNEYAESMNNGENPIEESGKALASYVELIEKANPPLMVNDLFEVNQEGFPKALEGVETIHQSAQYEAIEQVSAIDSLGWNVLSVAEEGMVMRKNNYPEGEPYSEFTLTETLEEDGKWIYYFEDELGEEMEVELKNEQGGTLNTLNLALKGLQQKINNPQQ